jgi:hypothetical protein
LREEDSNSPRGRFRDYDSSGPPSRSNTNNNNARTTFRPSQGQRAMTDADSGETGPGRLRRPEDNFDIERPLSQNSEEGRRNNNNHKGPGTPYLPLSSSSSGKVEEPNGSGSARRVTVEPLTTRELAGLRQKMLQKQINQLQKLLSSLNLGRE